MEEKSKHLHSSLRDDQRRLVEETYGSNESLIGLVTDLLVIARMGNIRENAEMLDLAEEVETIIDTVKGYSQGALRQRGD